MEKLENGNDLKLKVTSLGREFGEHMMRDKCHYVMHGSIL
jgi:hypothetical protein